MRAHQFAAAVQTAKTTKTTTTRRTTTTTTATKKCMTSFGGYRNAISAAGTFIRWVILRKNMGMAAQNLHPHASSCTSFSRQTLPAT
ncbi:unnamed protein product [Gongylonema pulchrum]|uniref:Secreted protein n=1 Tax=Gongylonema pulchrum TaxID=637853 RepID=A0A183DUF5_9BILA|nr:unnamed protein product [Gongylonema pulchrum]